MLSFKHNSERITSVSVVIGKLSVVMLINVGAKT